MKRKAKRLLSLLLMALTVVCLLSVAALAEAVETIEGEVLASTCPVGDIVLTGDATLIMDKDLILRSIRGNYDLTIQDQGGHTLTITMPMSDKVITANGAGHGISVKSLTCDADLDIKARKDGLNIDGDINYTAKTLAVTCGGDAVYSRNGSVTLTGVSSAMLEAKGSCLYAAYGTVRFEGASLMAESTGDSFCVAGNNVVLSATDKATITSKANAVVSGGGAGIWLSGKFDVTGGYSYGYAIQAKDTGSVVMAEGTEITAVSDGGGVWAGGSVQMLGDGALDITAKNRTGVSAESGSVELKGSVKVSAKKQALLAKNGAVAVAGSVNAQSSESGAACIMGGSVNISGESLYAAAKASAILSTGEEGITLNLSGPITAVADSDKSSVLDAKNGGVSVNGGEGSKLIGTGYGIYATGEVSVSGKVKVEAVKDAIHADGAGVWITGDVEVSTESEKYTGIYTSAEDATIHLQKYGSISVSSKGRGIYAKGNFLKQNYGNLVVEAADTAIEAKSITIINGPANKVTSKNEYGLVAAEKVNLDNCNLEIHALKSCIVAETITAEGGGATQIKAYTDEDMEYYRSKKILDPYYRVICATGDITLAAGGGVVAHACGATPIYAEGKITFQGPVSCYQRSSSKGYLVCSEQGFFVEDHLYLESPKEGYIWSSDGFFSHTSSTTSFVEKPQISGTVSIKTAMGSSTVAVPQDMIEASLIDVSDGEKTYQWQSSTDNVNWTDLEGQTDQEFYVRAKHTGLWLRVAVSVKNHMGALYSNAIAVPESTMLEGSIVYTSGAKVGGPLQTARTGLLKTMENTAPDSVRFQWQHSPNGENYWEDIDGATISAYTITAADVGTYLRLVASVDGMTGKVVSPVKEIKKAPANDDSLAMSSLSYADGVITVTRAFSNQEYAATLSAGTPTASEWAGAVSPAGTGELAIPVSGSFLNQSVYVHTRVKETATTLAGTRDKYSVIYTGQGEYLAGLAMNASNPMSDMNSKVGRSVALTVSPLPETYPAAQWSSQTVNWYVNNNPLYPGAVELYQDADCTTPLERDEYGVIKPTTRHTVYMKASSWTNNVQVGAEKQIGPSTTLNAHVTVNVANEDGKYILQNMYFQNPTAFPGDEITTSFITRPAANAYLGSLSFVPRGTNPACALELTPDTAAQTVTVTVPEDAEPGIYAYTPCIDGVQKENVGFLVVTVKEKSATVSFDDGGGELMEARLMGETMPPQTVPLGAQYILPENGFDVPDGYEFDGWDLGESGDGIDVTEDVKVTAKWRAHVHTMTHTEAYENTCTAPGCMGFYYCEGCGKYYGDEYGLYGGYDDPAMYMTPAAGHTPAAEAAKENDAPATCTEDGGYDMVVRCTVCGDIISSEHTAIPATGHTPAEAVQENPVAPTCTAAGSCESVVYCTACEAEISRTPVVIPALGHTLTHIPAKAASCEEAGNTAYYACETCGAWFTDAEGANEIEDHHTAELDALGHDYGAPEYIWSDEYKTVTATVACRHDESHTASDTAESVYEVTTPATTESDGVGTYTATFSDPVFGTATEKVTIPKIPTYTVAFLPNGGTGSMDPVTTEACDYLLPECGFGAPADMLFKAWLVGGVEYQPGVTVAVAADTDVMAVWAENEETGPAVTAIVDGGKLTYTVENAPAGAKLIAARYDGGRMTAVQIVSPVSGSGTLTLKGSGAQYKLFLVDGVTHRPLCEPWTNM